MKPSPRPQPLPYWAQNLIVAACMVLFLALVVALSLSGGCAPAHTEALQ